MKQKEYGTAIAVLGCGLLFLTGTAVGKDRPQVIAEVLIVPRDKSFLRVIRPSEIHLVSCHYKIFGDSWGRSQVRQLESIVIGSKQELETRGLPVNSRVAMIVREAPDKFSFVGSLDYANGESVAEINGSRYMLGRSVANQFYGWAKANQKRLVKLGSNCEGETE